jgi:hypothetical protein
VGIACDESQGLNNSMLPIDETGNAADLRQYKDIAWCEIWVAQRRLVERMRRVFGEQVWRQQQISLQELEVLV